MALLVDHFDELCPPSMPARPRRLRVLLSAFAAAARGGSEVAIGWNVARNLAGHHDVTVLCTPRVGSEDFRARNDEYFATHGPIEGLTMHYVDPPRLSRFLQHEHMTFLKPLYYAGYASWQRAALRAAQALHARRPFDVAHHLNITGYREPGYLWQLGVPFFWGPIGGAVNFPTQYLGILSRRDRLFYLLRNATNEFQKHFARRPSRAARNAAILWAIGGETAEMIRRHWGRGSQLALEAGSNEDPVPPRPVAPPDKPLRIAWSGLHIGRKALPLLLHALARVPQDALWRAVILGDGNQRNAWQRLASRLGLDDRVEWTGSLLQKDAIARMAACDVLAFTGLLEGTAVTVTEALGLGLPVICHKCCGMQIAVTDECGIRVPPAGVEASIAGFAAAITRLARDRSELQRLSDGARARARELTWARLAAQIAAGYDSVLNADVNR